MKRKTQTVPLFGEVVITSARMDTREPDGMDRLKVWAGAFERWISEQPSTHTQRAYRKAWNDLLAYTERLPWQIGPLDVKRWAGDMRARGLADRTRQQRIAAISSFYKFVSNQFTVTRGDGQDVPLHHTNPAASADLRAKIDPYEGAIYLGAEEARALLRAISKTTVQGLRDYALFAAYLITGRKNSEIRLLRWRDIEQNSMGVWCYWSQNGQKAEPSEFALPVWEAIRAYLKAAGRLEQMQPEDFIFTALTARAARLPNVPNTFDPYKQPLSTREVGRLLKVYCRRGGLDPEKVHVSTLRHSAAMLRKEAGDDVQAISTLLGRSNVHSTEDYLEHFEGQKDKSWAKVERMLGM